MTDETKISSPETIAKLRRLRSDAIALDKKLKQTCIDLRNDPSTKLCDVLNSISDKGSWGQFLVACNDEKAKLNAVGRKKLHDAVWSESEEEDK